MKNLITLYREPDPAAAVIDPAADPAVKPAAGAEPADLKPASVQASVDINNPPPKVEAAPAFVLPDAYKDKVYLKSAKSMDDVYKMLDGAQELIGKKGPGVPKDDAPQTEWDAYYESLGRPKTAAEYKFEGADKADPKFFPKVQEALHAAGLTPKQASTVWSKVNAALGEYMTEAGAASAAADVDFTKLATETFGTDRDRVLARGKELIGAHISPAMKAASEKLDNNALVVLADILRNIDKKFISPDGAPNKQPTMQGGTPDEIRAKAKGLMAEQAKYNSMSVEFNNLQTQIDALYDSLRKPGR